jgi:hypothetical protein
MANPNIVNVTSIYGNTAYVTPSAAGINTFNWAYNGTTALPMLTPSVGTVNRVTEISVANVTSSAATATVIVGASAVFTGTISSSTTSLAVASTAQGAIAVGMFLYSASTGLPNNVTIASGSSSPYTVSSAATATITSQTIYGIAASSYMAYQISVPPNATLIIIDKTNSVYITENQGIVVASGTANALTFAATFEQIS